MAKKLMPQVKVERSVKVLLDTPVGHQTTDQGIGSTDHSNTERNYVKPFTSKKKAFRDPVKSRKNDR